MFEIVKTTLARPDSHLWQDAVGAIALAVILVGVLHLPAMI